MRTITVPETRERRDKKPKFQKWQAVHHSEANANRVATVLANFVTGRVKGVLGVGVGGFGSMCIGRYGMLTARYGIKISKT